MDCKYFDLTKPSSTEVYDLGVIGGGISGLSAAREACLRGLKVVLLEANDYGFGASSKTSKLAHGGLRYLEQGNFDLVRQSLQERNLLLSNAPHLVKPLSFILPIYKGSKHSFAITKLGLWIYDLLSWGSPLQKHASLSKNLLLKKVPQLKSSELKQSCVYYDAQMKDKRLLIETLLDAQSLGLEAYNYCSVQNISKQGDLWDLQFDQQSTQSQGHLRCKALLNTCGPWSNDWLKQHGKASEVKPSKGVHLVFPSIGLTSALILSAPQDGRVFFVMPWMHKTLLGTTDNFEVDDLDKPQVTDKERCYLLKAFRHYFPELGFERKDILAEFAGYRPLAYSKHNEASKASRDHLIDIGPEGLISMIGGKYTTFRQMGEEACQVIFDQLGQKFSRGLSKKRLFPGAQNARLSNCPNLNQQAEELGLSKAQRLHLDQNYGSMARHILDILKEKPEQLQKLAEPLPHIEAELTYSIRFEQVRCAEDWYLRRSDMAWSSNRGKPAIERVCAILQEELSWTDQRRNAQAQRLEKVLT